MTVSGWNEARAANVATMELADWHMWWKRSGAADLRRILMEDWDPIGVRGVPEAADEYDSYLPQIGSRLRDGATKEELVAYLTSIEEDRMGLTPSDAARRRNQVLAARLRDWYLESTAAEAS
jgi:hypothetical protein